MVIYPVDGIIHPSNDWTQGFEMLCSLFDVGDSLHISPLERSYKAKVLLHFPSNVDWNPFDEHAVRMVRLHYTVEPLLLIHNLFIQASCHDYLDYIIILLYELLTVHVLYIVCFRKI